MATTATATTTNDTIINATAAAVDTMSADGNATDAVNDSSASIVATAVEQNNSASDNRMQASDNADNHDVVIILINQQ